MKERQRWRSEEDAVLRAYVKQYGPHEWSLVSQRMGVAFDRDAKSCLERWKNYLKPGLKKGSLTEEEQCLVIRLQAKHGNKWKKIAAEVPGRTAKRLGKWWEVFKEKQRRELEEASSKTLAEPIDQARYDHILENFAEKLVKDQRTPSLYMAAPLLQQQPPWLPSSLPPPPAAPPLPSSSSSSSPSVTLSLSPTSLPADGGGPPMPHAVAAAAAAAAARPWVVSELVERCREVEEGHRAWAAHRKEAAWRLKRVELQLELEKACKRKEKILEIESRVRALREEQAAAVEKIEAEFRDQLSALRRDAELKEQKLAEQWAAKHLQLAKLLDQMMGPLRRPSPDTAGP